MSFTRVTIRYDDASGVLKAQYGFFVKKSINIHEVTEIEAISKDELTHEGIFVVFRTNKGGELALSEFDKGFGDVIKSLQVKYPGLKGWKSVVPSSVFAEARVVLWSGVPK